MTENQGILVGGRGQKPLTIPMQLGLYALLNGGEIPYPVGQARLIRMGLYNRGLIRDDASLTTNGRFMAKQIQLKIKDGRIVAEWGLDKWAPLSADSEVRSDKL